MVMSTVLRVTVIVIVIVIAVAKIIVVTVTVMVTGARLVVPSHCEMSTPFHFRSSFSLCHHRHHEITDKITVCLIGCSQHEWFCFWSNFRARHSSQVSHLH